MSERPQDADAIAMTRAWVARFVVARNICPFAGREVRRDTIRYALVRGDDPQGMLHALIDECRRLDAEPAIETTLMILPDGMSDFEDYLDLLGVAESLLEAEGYAGIYQLASFHPDYVFEGVAADDPANYTNRSPWPMWHLLRESGVEAAVAAYPDPEAIPERNIDALREAGHAALTEEWAVCRAVRADE